MGLFNFGKKPSPKQDDFMEDTSKHIWTDEELENLPHALLKEVEIEEHSEGYRAGLPLNGSRSWYYRAGQQARWEEDN